MTNPLGHTCKTCGQTLPDSPQQCVGCCDWFTPDKLNEARACAECTRRAELIAMRMMDARSKKAKR